MTLPSVPTRELISERLPLIFPEGLEYRQYVIRDMAVRTIYVLFYAGAIEGTDRWIRPSQVIDMTDDQQYQLDEASRETWASTSLSQKKNRPANTWYAPNSREPIRDETIRSGFALYRAVIEREGIPTSSSKPRYALNAEFSALFDASLVDAALTDAIEKWQATHLSKAAMTRLLLVKNGVQVARVMTH